MWAGTKDWVYKHRHKLGGAAVVAGVVGVMWYMPEHNPLSASFGQPTATAAGARGQRQAQAEGVEAGDAGEDEDWPTAVSSSPADLSSTSSRSASAAQRASTQRSRILLRVRKEFSTQALQFLPLLQSKVLRAVDFDHAYDQLKELKRQRGNGSGTGSSSSSGSGSGADKAGASPSSSGSGVSLDSNQLWEQIKDSSFTYLFVTAYATSVMCVLMRVQLHVQARLLVGAEAGGDGAGGAAAEGSGSGCRGASTGAGADVFDRVDTETLKTLVNRTYSSLYGAGLQGLTKFVRSQVTSELADWAVCDTNILVEYQQLARKMSNIRKACEANFPSLLSSMSLVPEGERETPERVSESQSSKHASGGGSSASAAGATASSEAVVSNLLAQTWDVVDSPLFVTVCTEAIDTCFRHISGKLRDKIFLPHDAQGMEVSGGSQPRTPPIASLLPQLKAIAKEMLPGPGGSGGGGNSSRRGSTRSVGGGGGGGGVLLTPEVRDIASGAALDSLCVAIFDARTHAAILTAAP